MTTEAAEISTSIYIGKDKCVWDRWEVRGALKIIRSPLSEVGSKF